MKNIKCNGIKNENQTTVNDEDSNNGGMTWSE